ncbi:hypothetical protein FHN55_00980 [Streptomyces sp. NP160]|uniref:hypothetical protein n=1 Tax=Streptomyces sp. NP160 TaxID=2586637 RepID=UPI0011182340|nr:hypothetical protein [Streptomyces sp. NP160]TNM70288.1 hypothetical protein FHN55_00980 [Streptomyces sp. NP160]
MTPEGGSPVERADPLAVLRRWEAQQGRRLVDPSLAAWDDLDSEAVLRARSAWGPAVPSGTRYWSRRRYLSFGPDGAPERLIEVQLLSAHQPSLRARHSDLLVAGSLGECFWVYALTSTSGGDVHLRTLQDPAGSAWDPAAPGGAASDHDPLWVLPLSRVSARPVLLRAA